MPGESAEAGEGGISPRDEFAIKQVVLKDLFDFQEPKMHPARPAIAACVISDPADGAKLAAGFAGHSPPVTNAATAINDQGEDVERATGRPVEVYAARIRELSCDHARVGAGWHSAPLVGYWYSYDLVRDKGVWKIVKRTVVGVG